MAQELKVYRDPKEGPCWREFYEKSEADKVIAEKDEEIAEKDEKIDELQKATDSAWSKVNAMYDEICHHKYKRCLAMAKWCHDKRTMSLSWDPADGHTADYVLHYRKWEKLWLALAEKFKEAK